MSTATGVPDVDDLRFGVNVGWMHGGGAHPVAAARAAEAAGFDVVTAADHVGQAGPLVALAAAAAVTERVRLRPYVLDHGFWNPGLLARDAATLDAMSDGRVELGLGVGYMAHEHAAVGLPFPGYADRLEALAGFARELRRQLADPGLDPAPAQPTVPLLIGAMSRPGLNVAAEHADVVALAGLRAVRGAPAGTFTLVAVDEIDDRVGLVAEARQRLGLPPAPLDALVQQVVVDRDPEEAAAEFAVALGGRVTVDQLLSTPFALFAATPDDAADELLRHSARWGITSWCTHAPSGPAFARVVEVVRGRAA